MAFRHDGFWHPMDNSRDYKHLNELWDAQEAPWKTWDVGGKKRRVPLPSSFQLAKPVRSPAFRRKHT